MKDLEFSISCEVFPQYYKTKETVVFQNESPNFDIRNEAFIEAVMTFTKEDTPQAYELFKKWNNDEDIHYDILVKQDEEFYSLRGIHIFFRDVCEFIDEKIKVFIVITYAEAKHIENPIDCGDHYIINS